MLGALLVIVQEPRSDAENVPVSVTVTIVSTGPVDGVSVRFGRARTLPIIAVSAVTNSAMKRISRVTA